MESKETALEEISLLHINGISTYALIIQDYTIILNVKGTLKYEGNNMAGEK